MANFDLSNEPPGDPPVPRYGVKETAAIACDLDIHAEELRLSGFTVLDSQLPVEQVRDFARRIDSVIARQEQEVGGAENLARIGDAGTGRAMLAYDETFLGLATAPRLLALIERVLGSYFVLSQQNAIVLTPGAPQGQARYHRDLPYQHFVSSRPLAINALFCVDPFTAENGATTVIPASHKYELFPADAVIRRAEKTVEAAAGAFIVLDAMVFHRAGENRSGALRRAVNHVFVLPFLRQQIDLPTLLGDKYARDPALRQLLGYDARTPTSVESWRQAQLQRLGER